MGIAVGFAGAVVPVIVAKRRQFLQPFVDIRDQAVFGIIDIDARGNVHGGDQNHAFADAAFRQRRLHLRGDVDVFPVFFRPESQVFSVKPHTEIIAASTTELDMVRSSGQTLKNMRLVGHCALLFVSLWAISLPAQQPAPAETPAALPPVTQTPDNATATDQPDTADQRDKDLHPLTPEQIREQQIRQFDPLDRSDEKAAKEKEKEREKAGRDQKKDGQTDTPLPGSIAASERDRRSARGRELRRAMPRMNLCRNTRGRPCSAGVIR